MRQRPAAAAATAAAPRTTTRSSSASRASSRAWSRAGARSGRRLAGAGWAASENGGRHQRLAAPAPRRSPLSPLRSPGAAQPSRGAGSPKHPTPYEVWRAKHGDADSGPKVCSRLRGPRGRDLTRVPLQRVVLRKKDWSELVDRLNESSKRKEVRLMKVQHRKLAEELEGLNFKPQINHYPIRAPRKPLYPGPGYKRCAAAGKGRGRAAAPAGRAPNSPLSGQAAGRTAPSASKTRWPGKWRKRPSSQTCR